MRFILSSLIKHLKLDFSFKTALPIVFFVSLLICFNQIYFVNIENKLNEAYAYTYWAYLIGFIKYLLVYWLAIAIMLLFNSLKINNLKKIALISVLGIAIYSFYSVFFGYIYLAKLCDFSCRFYVHYLLKYFFGVFTLFIPLLFIYKFFRKDFFDGFYGLNFKNISYLRYIDMFLLIIVIMFFVVQLPEIKSYYPIVNYSYYRTCANFIHVPKWLAASIFELFYLFDFIWVELFFRGFLVIGMMKFLGKNAILPMSVFYVVIHFGKPMPEIISSFFGAYLLGVIAYQTNNIRAGIVLHITLALSTEILCLILN